MSETKLKYSQFNYLVELEDKNWGLYNFRTGKKKKLSPLEKIFFDNILEMPDSGFAESLEKSGILVNFDEHKLYHIRRNMEIHNSGALGLTICPTMACNFRCIYCFEDHGKGKMSPEIQNKVLERIEEFAREKHPKRVTVTWFGGEPLLCMDIICKLSEKILSLSEEYHFEYIAGIVTNGYLLSQEIADQLHKYSVKTIQITLDGTKEFNDKSRPLANGEGSFDKILENLRTIHFEMPVSVRCNVQKENLKNYEQLESLLKQTAEESGNEITSYEAHMDVYDGMGRRIENLEIPMEDFQREMLKKKSEVYVSLASRGMLGCNVERMYSMTIDDEGYLYKCWNHAGTKENCVGNIMNQGNIWIDQLQYETGVNLLDGSLPDEECEDCLLLWLCNGGCWNQRKLNGKEYVCRKYLLSDLDSLVKELFENKNTCPVH